LLHVTPGLSETFQGCQPPKLRRFETSLHHF